MLFNKLVTIQQVGRCHKWFLVPLKIPSPPLAKLYKTVIEWRLFYNNRNIEDPEYEERKTDLIKELEEQKTITTISMILEASLESSFQFLFVRLCSAL